MPTTEEQIAQLTLLVQQLTALQAAQSQPVRPGSWLANIGLFGFPSGGAGPLPGQFIAASGARLTIPQGFEAVYGTPPTSAQFRKVGGTFWRAASGEYEQWLRGWGGLIREGEEDYPDAQALAEANKQYVAADMGEVLLFRGKTGASAAWPKSGVKRTLFNPEPANPGHEAPLRPFRWEKDEFAAGEAADPKRADEIIAIYQIRRRAQGLPVGKLSHLILAT